VIKQVTRSWALAVVVVFIAGVAGCGIPSDEEARTIPPEALPAQVTEPRDSATTTSVRPSATTLTERYYLVRTGPTDSEYTLEPVEQAYDVNRDEITEAVMRALMDAPNQEQPPAANVIPASWQINSLRVASDGVLDIDFNSAIKDTLIGEGLNRALAQIVFTATFIENDPQNITGVRFYSDGVAIPVPTEGGQEVAAAQPVSPRANYPLLCSKVPACSSPQTAGSG
jgi:spore germination protein GerM